MSKNANLRDAMAQAIGDTETNWDKWEAPYTDADLYSAKADAALAVVEKAGRLAHAPIPAHTITPEELDRFLTESMVKLVQGDGTRLPPMDPVKDPLPDPDLSGGVPWLEHTRCPRCNCTLIQRDGKVWCSFVGGEKEKPCTYGIDAPRRMVPESDPMKPWPPHEILREEIADAIENHSCEGPSPMERGIILEAADDVLAVLEKADLAPVRPKLSASSLNLLRGMLMSRAHFFKASVGGGSEITKAIEAAEAAFAELAAMGEP